MIQEVTISSINPSTFEFQEYSSNDTSLISSNQLEVNFNPETDYLEYYVYNLNQNIVFSNIFGYPNFTLLDNKIALDPESDLKSTGNIEGQYNTLYNFLRRKLSSSAFQRYFIQEISSDRTEIRLDSTTISNADIVVTTTAFEQEIQNTQAGYLDFYLNFGDNNLVIANNILLDNSDPSNPTILIKLYDPLPLQFNIKSECWVVEQIAESVAYNINILTTFNIEDESIQLKGPNLNLSLNDSINNSTNYIDYQTLTASSYATGSANLEYQINSILAERGIEINVDYSDYTNFIYLSSAQTRLENFYYKLQLIEEYTTSASLSQVVNPYVTESRNIWQAKINEIITTFDGYDYYLYYESGSTAWPKTNSTYPYINTSSVNPGPGYNWFLSQSAVAEEYDRNNNNALINAIPSYLREDASNAEYELFTEMLGEMFDNIWIYYQDVTNKWNADNRLQYGVSKDLVADILRDLGVKIYESSFGSTDLYTGLLGLTQTGDQFPFPNITSSLPVPSGYEYINTKVSASNDVVSLTDVEKSFYKRLYHNIPLLLKKKGTVTGLRNLITSYGIPDTILRINEYGGKDKNNSNDWDYWYNQYNYAYTQNGDNFISSSWNLNSTWGVANNVPATLMFKFKTNGLPTSNIPRSQSLWNISGSSGRATIILTYTGSGYITSSFISSSASPIDPYYQYAKLDFIPNTASLGVSASVYLPFFNGDWWSVMLTSGSSFTLYAKNSIYNGYDGSILGFQATGSVAGNNSIWIDTNTSFFGSASISNYRNLSGSFQEIRYYTVPISESVFDDYVMNPNSIEGNGINQGPNQLAFRASLGGELYTGSTSIHPKVTGSWVTTSSFSSDSNFNFDTTPVFVSNTQSVFFDQPPVGIKNPVADKIKQQNIILPYSSSLANIPSNTVLSPFRSIQQDYAISQSYTKDINYVETAFSPQNEINDDISSQIGYINIGEYIGDPRLVSSSAESYPALNALRDAYFEKYTHNYDINDYIRLIKYFDNSLFKMVKDFTPARSGLASGVVIKQHLLERNKYPIPQAIPNTPIAYYGSGSGNIAWDTPFTFQNILVTGSGIQMYTITGSNGGVFPNLNGQTSSLYVGNSIINITQSWSGITPSVSGSVPFTQSSQIEFFNGELSGSALVVTDGNLNGDNPFLIDENKLILLYTSSFYKSGQTDFSSFFDPLTTPPPGEIYLYWDNATLSPGTGVKFIKLAKTDANGSNNNLILERIKSIIALAGSYESPNPVVYNIIGVSDYGTYYLYNTSPTNVTSSLYNQIKNYPVSASKTAQVVVTYPTTSLFTNYSILAGTNALNYFTASSGIYMPKNTPNVSIIFTASATWDSGSNDYIAPKIVLAQGTTSSYIEITSSILYGQDKAGGTIYLSGSFSPIEDQTYFIGVTSAGFGYGAAVYGKGEYGISSETIRYTTQSLLLTQSIASQSVSARDFTIDPYISELFQNSDYDVLINNVINNRKNSFYMIVDDNDNQITASNQSLILNNTALKASVPDSYYTYARQINSRYLGKELTSAQVNLWTEGDISYGKSPNISLLKNHFIYFNDITVSSPEWGDNNQTKTNVSIRYIIDENKSLIKPINDAEGINLSTIQRSFDGNAILVLNSEDTFGTNLSTANGTWSVFRAGKRIKPILYTQIANYDNNGNIIGFEYTNSINLVSSSLTASCNSFWIRDITYNNIISANNSSPFSLNNFVGWRQTDINTPNPSGFDPITLDFIPQPLDEIRFEGNEDYTYTILSISTSSGILELTLDRNIDPNINLEYFLLRRYTDDPSNIILNLNKPAGASSAGILKPEYITVTLDSSILEIVEKIQSETS